MTMVLHDVVPSGPVEPILDVAAFSPSDMIIAVMGMTGAGKSSFIAHLCGTGMPRPEIGHGQESQTQTVEVFQYKQSATTTVHLVDTPGFDDSSRSDKQVLAEISLWLAQTYQSDVKLNGIIYLHRISDNRIGNSARRNLKMFQKLCGDDALKKVILATTMWEKIPEDQGKEREMELINTPKFWGTMCDKGSQVLRHYNTAESAKKIMQVFVDTRSDPRVALDIQRELVTEHKTLDETTAGKEVVSVLAAEREKLQVEMAELRQEWIDAMAARDLQAAEDARQDQIETESRFQQLEQDRAELTATLEQLEAQKRLLEDQNRQHAEQMRTIQGNMQRMMTQQNNERHQATAASEAADVYAHGAGADSATLSPWARAARALETPEGKVTLNKANMEGLLYLCGERRK